MVWSHSEIENLAKALGVEDPPEWLDMDFDSIWEISYQKGKANLRVDQEGLKPSIACNF